MKRRELEEKRTRNSKLFENQDHSFTREIYLDPVHYKEDDGSWREMDDTITEEAELEEAAEQQEQNMEVQKDFVNKKGSWKARFKNNYKEQGTVTLTKENCGITWALEGAEKVKAVKDGGKKIIYPGVMQGVDSVLSVHGEKIKEDLVLASPEAPAAFTYLYRMKKLKAAFMGKRVAFTDENGEEVFSVAAPYMKDKNGEKSEAISIILEECVEEDQCRITFTPDSEWLKAPEREYPVVIDPVTTTSLKAADIQDAHVDSLNCGDNFYNSIILKTKGGDNIQRSFLKFKLPDIEPADMVINAQFGLGALSGTSGERTVQVHKVLQDWDSSTITWNNKPVYEETVQDCCKYTVGEGKWVSFDITRMVKDWYENGNNFGLMMKDDYELSGYTEFLSSDCHDDFEDMRPRIDIQYVNYSGLEAYWTYHSQSAGRAGTLHVNDYNGNVVMVHDLMSTSGSLMPAQVSLVYNSNDRLVNIGYGYGFRLNYHQTLKKVTIGDTDYYKYTDGDGTIHYFYYNDKKEEEKGWKDESGLDLTLAIGTSEEEPYVITDKEKNRMIFSKYGYLIKVCDKNANALTINYNGKAVGKITDGAGRVITFTYLKDAAGEITNLSEVKDPSGKVKTIAYTRDQITSITDVDGAVTRYSYNSSLHLLTKITNVDNYAVKCEYSEAMPYRVKTITEYGGKTEGNSLSLTYGYNSTKYVDNKGRKEIYRFNHQGNLLHIHDDFGHAASGKFTNNKDHENRLENTSRLQDNIIQLLKDPIIQAGKCGWTARNSSSTEISADINEVAANVKVGTRSLALTSTSTAEGTYWMQSVPVKKGETYTFSMYVKAVVNEAAENGRCFIRMRYFDKDGAAHNKDSEWITETTSGFMQLHTTCTIPADTADERVIVYLYLYHVNGTMYGDVAQLEPGTVPSRCNLVDNGDFHLGNTGDYSKPGTAACDELTKIGTEVNLPAQYALMVTKASAILYKEPNTTATQAATVYNGQHLASAFLFTQMAGNTKTDWYRVKTSGGTWGYIQSADVLSYLPNGNSSTGGAVLKNIAVLRSSASHTSTPVEEYVPKGTGVVVRSKATDADGNNWYRVALQIDNKRYSGYLPAGEVIRFARNNAYGEMAAADNYYKNPSLTAEKGESVAKGSKVSIRGVVYVTDTEKWYTVLSGKEYVFLPETNLTLTEAPIVASLTKTKVTEKVGELDTNIFKFLGTASEDKKLTKTLDLTGKKGDTYMVNAWGHGTALPETDNDKNRRFGVEVVFVSDTAGVEDDVHYTNFSPDIMDWQFLSDVYVSKISYKKIEVSYTYCHNANIAFFDGLSLFREEFGQTYKYDDKNNLISVTDAQKQSQKFEYNEKDELTGVVDAKGNKFEYKYDAQGNVTQGTSAEGVVYQLEYKKGNIEKSGCVDPKAVANGTWITRTFTADDNHVKTVTDAGNNTVTYDWDTVRDVLKSVTDARGNKISYGYDDADRLVSVAQNVTADGVKRAVENSYTYEKDRLTAIHHNGFSYGFAYDIFGNTLSASVAGAQVVSYEYEPNNGNLLKTIYGNGDYIRYTYDKQDRMLLSYYKNASSGTEQKMNEYVYDKQGNLTQVTAHMAGKTYRLYYDFLDRLMRVVDEQGTSYEYLYDANNNMVRMTHYCGAYRTAASYTYDRDSRETLARLTSSLARTTKYDTFGRVESQSWDTPTPFVSSYTYFDEGVNRYSLPKTVTNGSEKLTYTYDANGNIASIKDAAGTSTFQYDELNQLIRENNHVLGKTITYSYDLGGNLVTVKQYAFTTADVLTAAPEKTETGVYDSVWKDKLVNWNGTEMTYDAIGNMLTKGSTSYTWTQGRKLATVNNGKNIQYFYDHTGARTKKVVDGVVTEYHMAGDLLLSETSEGRTCWYRYDSGANLISVNIKGEIYLYIRNAQNDIIGLVDEAGNVVVRYKYDSWGKLIGMEGSLADTVGVQNPFRYRGYYYDNETGMYYLKSRYYDPEIRRFVSADSQVNKTILGGNLFAYCENNPVNKADYNGHAAVAVVTLLGLVAILGGSLISNLPSTQKSATNFVQSISRGFTQKGNIFTKDWSSEDYQSELKLSISRSFTKIKADPWYKGQTQVHHIVAKSSRKAERARAILRTVNIGINDEENLVPLKRGLHQRLHHGIYYEWINREIESAYNDNTMNPRESVSNKLATIKGILLVWNAAAPF